MEQGTPALFISIVVYNKSRYKGHAEYGNSSQIFVFVFVRFSTVEYSENHSLLHTELFVIYVFVVFLCSEIIKVVNIVPIKFLCHEDCFLQKEARVCVSNAFVLEDSMLK